MLDQCGPGLTCVSIITQERWPITNRPGPDKLYENSFINSKKPARCRPGKGSVDEFTSICVYVSSCKLVAIIIEVENESCEKDEDCLSGMTCVKHYRFYDEKNVNPPNGRPAYIEQEIRNRTTGICMGRPGSVANISSFFCSY